MTSKDTMDCACFGEILWDLFEDAAAGTKAKDGAKSYRRELGGAPTNVAVSLARLGFRPSIVGAVGKDAFGDALVAILESEGVETKHVAKLPERTGITFVTRNERGEPSFLFYRHETADAMVRASELGGHAARATFGVVGTSTLINPGLEAATMKFAQDLEKAKGDLVVDLNVRAHLWPDHTIMKRKIGELVRKAKLVKASEGDLAHLAGKRGLSWLEEHATGATWILTRGENGAAAVGAHGQVTAPTKRVRCVDATGAGDAFLAGALGVLLASGARSGKREWADAKTWTRALEVGHIMGAKAVSAVGAVSGLLHLDDVKGKIALARKAVA